MLINDFVVGKSDNQAEIRFLCHAILQEPIKTQQIQMKLTANFKVMIDDEKSDVEFSMEQAENEKVNTLLALSKFFFDVEKKVRATMDKFNIPATSLEPQSPIAEEKPDTIEDVEEGELIEEIPLEDETTEHEGGVAI